MIAQEQSFIRKIFILATTVCIVCILIVIRLGYLQINLTQNLLKKSQHNFLRYEKVNPLRGNIIDYTGKLLATNRPVINVYWKGNGNKKLSEEQKKLLAHLKTFIPELCVTQETLEQAERKAQKIVIAQDLPFDLLSKISEQFSADCSIIIETDFARFYPYNTMASHILGYLGNLDTGWAGKMGLEKLYESSLKGKHGINQKILNSFGKHLSEKQIEQSLAGQDLTITLDLSLQKLAEMLFPAEKKGIFLLMDSKNGNLRVAVSRPNFDPNRFLEKLNQADWQVLKDNKPFLNRIYNACYPPGSIFKLVTLSAALETDIIQADKIINCKGSTKVGQRKFHCHRKTGHGPLSITESVAKSCNILFYRIARDIDVDTLANYAGRFGLGKNTNSVFNDNPGLIPTKAWKLKTKGERWWLGETLATCIGQSFLLVTPIQIARMIASIDTGYLVTPRILEESTVHYEPLNIAHSTRLFLQDTMKEVVNEGTARILANLKGFEVFAKTSTAQTSDLEKRDMGEQYLEHGWVAVNFKYKNEPTMTMVVLVENAGSAALSLMIARAFLKGYRDLTNLRTERQKKASV